MSEPRFAGTDPSTAPTGTASGTLGFGLHPAARGRGRGQRRAAGASLGLRLGRGSRSRERLRRQLGLPAQPAWRCGFRVEGTSAAVRETGRRDHGAPGRLPDQGRADGAGPPWLDVPGARPACARGASRMPLPPSRPLGPPVPERLGPHPRHVREVAGTWQRCRMAEGEAVVWLIADPADAAAGAPPPRPARRADDRRQLPVAGWCRKDAAGAPRRGRSWLRVHAFADPATGGLGPHRTDVDHVAST